jgi:hypothetical protein
MAFIVTLIEDALIADITEVLDTEDEIAAGLVRRGPLQENPVDLVTSVLVNENDPSSLDGWLHQQLKPPMNEPMYSNLVSGVFEVGGSELYLRRFTLELKLYLMPLARERAEAKALMSLAHGRVIRAVRYSERLGACSDEFGERTLAHRNCVAKSRMVLRGGPPTDWLGEGKIWLSIVTWLP